MQRRGIVGGMLSDSFVHTALPAIKPGIRHLPDAVPLFIGQLPSQLLDRIACKTEIEPAPSPARRVFQSCQPYHVGMSWQGDGACIALGLPGPISAGLPVLGGVAIIGGCYLHAEGRDYQQDIEQQFCQIGLHCTGDACCVPAVILTEDQRVQVLPALVSH